MVDLIINNKIYQFKTEWEDMTIQEAIDIRRLIDDIPEKLKTVYECYATKRNKKNEAQLEKKLISALSKITKEDEVKVFPVFYGDIIMALSNIPKSVMKRILWLGRTQFYDKMCIKIVTGLLWEPKKVEPLASFEFEGIEYFCPTEKKMLNEVRPMGHAESVEFAESSDLEIFARKIEGGQYSVLTNIISILYRPKGEAYNEDVSLKRAEKFGELDMRIGFGVFFYLKRLATSSMQSIQIYKAVARMRKVKKLLEQVASTNLDG